MLKKKSLIPLVIIILLGIGFLFAFILNQKPLTCDGFSEYNNSKKQVDISLVNSGGHDIFIKEVLVNNKVPEQAQLVISYSAHLVASGIDGDPFAKFINISEAPIHPQLTLKEFEEAVKTNTTPIHYGIRINNEEDIEVVKIKYKYMGLTFRKEVNLSTWPR